VRDVTNGYKSYELDKATRPITDFIDDLSVWYLRRSRDRLKGEDAEDKKQALATLRYSLRALALVMAPVMPFYAEYLWQKIKEENDAESVHLAKWPEATLPEEAEVLNTNMVLVRKVVTEALEARTKLGIKVRQPIPSVTGPDISEDMQKIVLDELNAKNYIVGESVTIDAILTPELIAEGAVRELMRFIQETRKQMNLEPADVIEVTVGTDEAGQTVLKEHKEMLTRTVGASSLSFADNDGETVETDSYKFTVTVTPK
jgi:isoleucyl-tRNA synthetase